MGAGLEYLFFELSPNSDPIPFINNNLLLIQHFRVV